MINPEKIWSSSQLPSLPSVAIKLLELSKNPTTEIKEVIDAIRTDPAITAKILKSANSAFFGCSAKVRSIDHAVPLLGTTVVTSLALSFSLAEAAMSSGPLARHYSSYWLQSVVQAVACEALSEFNSRGLDCEYFLAGLLTDLGRLAMLRTISKEYLPVLEQAETEQRSVVEVEQEMLGVDHVSVGIKLMERWSLPTQLARAVELHHASREVIAGAAGEASFDLTKTVAVAAAVGEHFCSANKGPAWERLKELGGAVFNLDEQRLNGLLERVKSRIDESDYLFAANAESLGDPGELMAQANEHLAQLAVRECVASTQAAARQQAAEQEKQALEEQNIQLQRQALFDPLTKVYNRHFFDEALERELSKCSRSASSIAVIFADVDHFKTLNDTYGHPFGDQVLQRIAQAFGTVLRKSDVLARYGGEEFVVLVHQPTEKGLERVAERIRASAEAMEVSYERERVRVTVSVGAAIVIPGLRDEGLAKKLIAVADEAMYDSKDHGRNQVHVRSLLTESDRQMAELVAARRFSRWLVHRKVFDIPTVSQALLSCPPQRVRIGELAVTHGYLDAAQVDAIIKAQQPALERFGCQAVRMGLLTEQQVAWLLATQQEDPQRLGASLLELGLLERSEVDTLLLEYREALAPRTRGRVVAARRADGVPASLE